MTQGKVKATLTGAQLLDLGDAIPQLAEHLINMGLALRAVDVGLNRQALRSVIVSLQDARNGIVGKYGTAGPAGQIVLPTGSPEYAKYLEELQPLQNERFEVEIRPVRVSAEQMRGLPGIVFLRCFPILEITE